MFSGFYIGLILNNFMIYLVVFNGLFVDYYSDLLDNY